MGKLEVKGHRIGEGKPLICVPIMKKSCEEIVEEARLLAEDGVEMLEWRVDAFSSPTEERALCEVMDGLAKVAGDLILIYTFRSKEQGGLLQLSQQEIQRIHRIAAEQKKVDFIDVEFFAGEDSVREITGLRELGIHVIASHHDFAKTPTEEQMRSILEHMRKGGADIVKLAVMPRRQEDVLALLAETLHYHRQYPDSPLITMSMGAMGSISRISGELFGSCVTFGAGERASAPGQLSYRRLAEVQKLLNLV